MRIDFVITELFVGGAERCMAELAIGMHRRGANVRVFSIGTLPSGEQAGLLNRLSEQGIDVAAANADRMTAVLRASRELNRWMSAARADVCQTFMFHANVLGTRAARSAGVPVVVGGLRVADPTAWRSQIERVFVKRMDRLVCVSEATRQFAIDQLRGDPDKLVTIGNGVDVARFESASPVNWAPLGWPADVKVALFVGRLHPQKGIDLLQRQAERILSESSRRIVLIGDGPLREELRRWADGFSDQNVRLLPWQGDVAPWMRAARLLVLPSRFEGMPNVVLEAMAAGKPVVCSDVEGSSELLRHSPDAQVFASGDDGAMADQIDRLMQDGDLAAELGRVNQDRVRAEFSIDTMIDKYARLYESLRSGRR